jgi:hypothetical protein
VNFFVEPVFAGDEARELGPAIYLVEVVWVTAILITQDEHIGGVSGQSLPEFFTVLAHDYVVFRLEEVAVVEEAGALLELHSIQGSYASRGEVDALNLPVQRGASECQQVFLQELAEVVRAGAQMEGFQKALGSKDERGEEKSCGRDGVESLYGRALLESSREAETDKKNEKCVCGITVVGQGLSLQVKRGEAGEKCDGYQLLRCAEQVEIFLIADYEDSQPEEKQREKR